MLFIFFVVFGVSVPGFAALNIIITFMAISGHLTLHRHCAYIGNYPNFIIPIVCLTHGTRNCDASRQNPERKKTTTSMTTTATATKTAITTVKTTTTASATTTTTSDETATTTTHERLDKSQSPMKLLQASRIPGRTCARVHKERNA